MKGREKREEEEKKKKKKKKKNLRIERRIKVGRRAGEVLCL